MQAPGFRKIEETIGTLFLILLGEFDYAEMEEVSSIWAIIFFMFFVIFMFFIVLNIFLAILNDAYTTTRFLNVWDELEERKRMGLRERFEVRRAIWRERKNIAGINKKKKEKIKAAKKLKKEMNKKKKDRDFLDRISRRKKREEAAATGNDLTDKLEVRRTAVATFKPFE